MNTYLPTIKLYQILTLCHICIRSHLKKWNIDDLIEAPYISHPPSQSSPPSSEVTITMNSLFIIPMYVFTL